MISGALGTVLTNQKQVITKRGASSEHELKAAARFGWLASPPRVAPHWHTGIRTGGLDATSPGSGSAQQLPAYFGADIGSYRIPPPGSWKVLWHLSTQVLEAGSYEIGSPPLLPTTFASKSTMRTPVGLALVAPVP